MMILLLVAVKTVFKRNLAIINTFSYCSSAITWSLYPMDVQVAAALGSQFAQEQLVKMNPYSKLCNNMLSVAITKLREGRRD